MPRHCNDTRKAGKNLRTSVAPFTRPAMAPFQGFNTNTTEQKRSSEPRRRPSPGPQCPPPRGRLAGWPWAAPSPPARRKEGGQPACLSSACKGRGVPRGWHGSYRTGAAAAEQQQRRPPPPQQRREQRQHHSGGSITKRQLQPCATWFTRMLQGLAQAVGAPHGTQLRRTSQSKRASGTTTRALLGSMVQKGKLQGGKRSHTGRVSGFHLAPATDCD